MNSAAKRKRLLDRHTVTVETRCQRPYLDADLAGPLGQRCPPAESFQNAVRTGVVGLLGARRPAAIPRLVISVHVIPLNGESRPRPRTHVGQELLETFRPSIANADPASAVIFERPGGWVRAPRFHGCPHLVLGRSGRSVADVGFRRALAMPAAAGLNRSLVEGAGRHDGLAAAIAPAMPLTLPAGWPDPHFGLSCDDKSPESPTHKIFNFSAHGNMVLASTAEINAEEM